LKEDVDRYLSAAHAMQTGVAVEQEFGSGDGSPKHLRVGINSRAVDHTGLINLLIEKEIITLDEYHKAIADEMEKEAGRYAQRIQRKMGGNVHLA
jgi:hypothetical protein